MEWLKKSVNPILIASFIAVIVCLYWLSSRVDQSSSDINCLMHMGSIASFIHSHQSDSGDPPKKLSDMSAEDRQLGMKDLLPRLVFVCPSDPGAAKAMRGSKRFYSSYQYYPDAAKSGKPEDVVLRCPHHMHTICCDSVAFEDSAEN